MGLASFQGIFDPPPRWLGGKKKGEVIQRWRFLDHSEGFSKVDIQLQIEGDMKDLGVTNSRILDINTGPFLCHAHLRGDVNRRLVASCSLRHRNADNAWACRTRRVEQTRDGTPCSWNTCRPLFCHVTRKAWGAQA